MTISEYFQQVLTDYMFFSRSLLPEASLPDKILKVASDEIDPKQVILALKRTAIACRIFGPNLRFHDVDQPAQAAGQLRLVAASRLRNLVGSRATTELKESVYAEVFTIFCLAYTAPNEDAFQLVMNEQRGKIVALP